MGVNVALDDRDWGLPGLRRTQLTVNLLFIWVGWVSQRNV